MRFCLLITVLLLSACAQLNSQQRDASQQSSGRDCGQAVNADNAVQLDVIEELMAQNRMYAALAHLDELDSDSLRATYLRAEILRQSDRPDAAAEYYRALQDTCMAGWSHHGLGLIAGREGDLETALTELSKASEALPVEPRVRNDYGYALLLNGDYQQARREFLTTLELDEQAALAETNMILLLYSSGQPDKAAAFAKRVDMDDATLAELAKQAETLSRPSRAD